MTGVYVLVAVLAVATAFGLWRRRTDGRMRDVPSVASHPHDATAAAAPAPPAPSSEAASSAEAGRSTDVAPSSETVPSTEAGGSQAGSSGANSEPLVVDGRPVEAADHSVVPVLHTLTAQDVGQALGERATLVQFSSAFCTPCRATRVVLGDVARAVPGVAHVEIDAESHLDLVRRLDVTRTPTVLVLDSAGRIRRRATGAPRRPDVVAALGAVV